MNFIATRKSWDTSVKHLARHGILDDILTRSQIAMIPSSNISRWKTESEDKYLYCEINQIISKEIALIQKMNQSSRIKNIITAYISLCETFHYVIDSVNGIKTVLRKHRDRVVNSIESVKDVIPVDAALKIFNLSRSSFEHYKNRLLYSCDTSYFKWCVKKHPGQLLKNEIATIKRYMTNELFNQWSKSSVYLKAIRDGNLNCSITTFYKYCSLLGFQNKPKRKKSNHYQPLVSSKPNEIWCMDVTIYKTKDQVKQYIHLLVDHYSKMILGFRIKSSSSGTAIKELLQTACIAHKPKQIKLLSDGGSENVNKTVAHFIDTNDIPIKHRIAQKDVVFSNSMIEAINKILKYQFLYAKEIHDNKQLQTTLKKAVVIYNSIRPQMSLGGNTPHETFYGKAIDFSVYSKKFLAQRIRRNIENKKSNCKVCCK